jgi:hypothetical protein
MNGTLQVQMDVQVRPDQPADECCHVDSAATGLSFNSRSAALRYNALPPQCSIQEPVYDIVIRLALLSYTLQGITSFSSNLYGSQACFAQVNTRGER